MDPQALYPKHSIGPMGAEEKKRAAAYIARNRNIPAGLTGLAEAYGRYLGRVANQAPKSFVQAAREGAMHVGDPEGLVRKASGVVDEELALLDREGLTDYLEQKAYQAGNVVDALLRSPEAVGDALGTVGLAKATRGRAFRGTNLDEAAIAGKAATEVLSKDYTEHPKTWAETVNPEAFSQEYAEAKAAARAPDRVLAPLWKATDRGDELIAARLEALMRTLAASR